MKSILKITYLAIFTLLISCGDAPSNENQDEVTQEQSKGTTFPDSLSYVTKNYERVFPECEGDDCTTYNLEYIELSDDEFSFINDSIKVEMIGNYATMDDAADEFFDEYEEVTLDMESDWNPAWSHDLTAGATFNKKGLFTVSYGYYGYMGGAHGMPGFSSTNYDLETKKELSLYDLVNIDDSTALKALGEKYFRIDNELKADADLQEAGYFWDDGTFYISEIFTLTDDGLMFTYSPYEIASYAAGMPEFTIPYTELKSYFTENSPLKRLME